MDHEALTPLLIFFFLSYANNKVRDIASESHPQSYRC